jgi:Zn-dependent M28 family amino/carboxypeptidase
MAILAFLNACSCAQKPHFDENRAFADLVSQCNFGSRVPGSEAHDKTADFLLNSLKQTTTLCRAQRFTYFDSLENKTLSLTNIIASYYPKKTNRIMLCAHWDSRPRAENDSDPSKRNLPIIGANDGASGVAILLELGRLLQNSSPPVGIDIILFDGEDWGFNSKEEGWFLGSKYFAANSKSYFPRAAVLLDMVGDKDLKIYREGVSQKYAGDLNDYIWQIARNSGSSAFADSVKYTISDDHVPLLSRGIKTVDIIDFDYPYWHTQEDTPDKCSPQSLATVGKVIISAIFDKQILKF